MLIKLYIHFIKTIFQNENSKKKNNPETFSEKNSLPANMYVLWEMLKDVSKQKENDGRGKSESTEKNDEY